jgi:nicotinate-nucleotide pyrophosphorylase (carboxylating)
MSTFRSEATDLIALALAEDLGGNDSIGNFGGDLTSQAFIPSNSRSLARIITRTPCLVSGLSTAVEVFRKVDPMLEVSLMCQEGDILKAHATLLTLRGSTRAILAAERTALNFLARLCGIATLSREYANAVRGAGVQLLDTRKTTPGWRLLEKQAVRAGGCLNHRMGLYDAVLVKDNHLAALADLALLPPVLEHLRIEHPRLSITVEADTLTQVAHLLTMPSIDVILLDNMSCDLLRAAATLRMEKAPHILLEASGGITLENVPEIARTGIDRISVGALTHSSVNTDLSLELEKI